MPTAPTDYPAPTLPLVKDGSFELQMEVTRLDEEPRFRVVDPTTGDTHYLSVAAIEGIRVGAMSASRGITTVNDARFTAHHPMRDPQVSRTIQQTGVTRPQAQGVPDTVLGTVIIARVEGNEEALRSPQEGEPKLTWQAGSAAGNDCGWSLTLHGGSTNPSHSYTPETALGFAAWNDPEGINRLISMLHDRQSVYVMAGVVDSSSTARLSSRLSAVSMRRARKLPAIRLKNIREIIQSAGLTSGSRGGQYQQARGRVVSIQVDDASVPVAVALIPPQRPSTCAPFPEDLDAKPWNEKMAITRQIEEAGREVWVEKAKEVVTAAGWRLVELPMPTSQYNAWRVVSRGSTTHVLFLTKIDETLWSELAPAAICAAENLNLNRSSLL